MIILFFNRFYRIKKIAPPMAIRIILMPAIMIEFSTTPVGAIVGCTFCGGGVV